ncbi:MAG TPA: hypothetical protein V6C91_09410 [Coleofasciculaceae cyanobacterium]
MNWFEGQCDRLLYRLQEHCAKRMTLLASGFLEYSSTRTKSKLQPEFSRYFLD